MLRCGMGERPIILLADDEAAITTELQPFLERAGFAVTVVRDGEAALAAGLEGDPT
jgi:DNA-binding response OmpR family regulator